MHHLPCRFHSSFSVSALPLHERPPPGETAFHPRVRLWSSSLSQAQQSSTSLQVPIKMSSQFDLSIALQTISVATTRILPPLLSSPSISDFFDTAVALNPVVTSFWLTHIFVVLQLFLSLLTRSFSWNDRVWPIIPLIYALVYTLHAPISSDGRTESQLDARLALMSGLVMVWGIRLTANAARRGYYKPGFLDHRYTWLQANVVRIKLLFIIAYCILICGFMTVLLALVSSPCYYAWLARGPDSPLSWLDMVAAAGMVTCVTIETAADNQQYAFQCRKSQWKSLPDKERETKAATGSFSEEQNGFVQTGLFAWSRHPNFFAEISGWWFFYLFSIAASGRIVNWTIIGPVLYLLLFQITTPLTERISADKYPAYQDYQQRVSRLIPSPFSRSATPSTFDQKKNN